VFAAVFKVYTRFSGRRFTTDMTEALARGYVGKAPHYNSIFRTLENPETTAILKRLVIQSSLPLRSVESSFAFDASGFSTCRFLRWFDEKYGVTRKKAEWVKCHIACGVKTNVVTAVEINDAGDSVMLPTLVATTAQNFTMKEVSADKAYSSFANLEFIADCDAEPFIAFKNNSRGDTGPTTWERMHAHFTLNREDYLRHYHKRSNVESTFSMIKGKFGDSVRSKTDTAMTNEVLCKVLCHNLCCLVHAIHELKIKVGLSELPPEPERETDGAILRFPGVA